MGLSTYVFILFGVSIAFFLTGSPSMIFGILSCDQTQATCSSFGTTGESVANQLINTLANPNSLIFIAGVSLTGLLTGGSFGVVYILPALIIIAFETLLFVPTDILMNESVPFEVRMIVLGFFAIFQILTIIEFVRGG